MIGFKAFTFKGKKTAMKTFHLLEDYPAVNYWIDDTAVVSRNKHGHLRVHSTWAQEENTESGLGWGVITGGLVGMLAGPGGVLVGAAAAGSFGALLGWNVNDTFNDPALGDFAAALENDTSAIILVGEEMTLADFGAAVEPFGGEVIDANLDEEDVKALRKVMEN